VVKESMIKHAFILGEGSLFKLLCQLVAHDPKIWWWANQVAPSGKTKTSLTN
jgi:hypothetical protein